MVYSLIYYFLGIVFINLNHVFNIELRENLLITIKTYMK